MNFTNITDFLDRITSPDTARGRVYSCSRIPGCELIINFGGREVYHEVFGFADIEEARPLRRGALYNLYSVSKVLTVVTALTLVERGELLMSDPVSHYIPAFASMKVKRPDGSLADAEKPVLAGDLFAMTSGIDYNITSPSVLKLLEGNPNPTALEAACAVAGEPLAFEPGSRWMYGLSLDVLGGLTEAVTGMSFGDYMKKVLLDPAGMNETYFDIPESRIKDRPSLYRCDDSAGAGRGILNKIDIDTNEYRIAMSAQSGGAGLHSTADDQIILARILTDMGKAPNGARILSPETVRLMRENRLCGILADDFTAFNPILFTGYGYGCGVRTLLNRTAAGSLSSVGEFGWAGTGGCYLLADPEAGLSVFYAQQLLNSQEPYVHPRLRNMIYASLSLTK